jgi:hypothetical protein
MPKIYKQQIIDKLEFPANQDNKMIKVFIKTGNSQIDRRRTQSSESKKS